MNKKKFLIELLVEEIPARFQKTASDNFSKLFSSEFNEARIQYSEVKSYTTPRRMAFSAELREKIPEFIEEKKGPRISSPNDVIEKFLEAVGVSRNECVEKEINDKTFIFANIRHEERNTADILSDIVKNVICALPWPKSMHWGEHSFCFVRPIRNIMCMFDGELINVDMTDEINLRSTNYTLGHRFMANKKVFAKNAGDYLTKMKEAFVIVDRDEREKMILDACRNRNFRGDKNFTSGIDVDIDEKLLEEVVGLTEYPIVMIGKFSEKFMRLPGEVITTTMKSHQRYFPTIVKGKLRPYFVFVANNISDSDGKTIIKGNERVLSARLSDALFFFDKDLAVPLENHLDDLKKIAFNEKLGTVYDRTLRIKDICGYLCDEMDDGRAELPPNSRDILKRAALLAKCDLATNVVCEFTELQGVMGAHYARRQGESDEVCNIIRSQYKSVEDFASPLCALYSMADKIDAITSLFAIGKIPSGSKDPFALRRAAIGIIKLMIKYEMSVDLRKTIEKAFERLKTDVKEKNDMASDTVDKVTAFILDRLRVVLKEAGIRSDIVDAILSVPQDIQSMQKKAKVLNSILDSESGEQILIIYKRAKNIIQEIDSAAVIDESLFLEKEEAVLFEKAKDFEASMLELENSDLAVADKFEAKLKQYLATKDAMSEFFTKVLVNTDDEKVKKNRAGILAKLIAVVDDNLPEVAAL